MSYQLGVIKMRISLIIICFLALVCLTACVPGPESVSPSPEATDTIQASEEPDTDLNDDAATPEIIADDAFVNAADYLSGIYIDLKYATEDNFTGEILYDFTDAYLRYGTVKKLAEVQNELLEQGCSLKIWDAFRPAAMQFKLWEICPDPLYVADPNKGFSSHSKGNTVDVTLVAADGSVLEMPSAFDDFSALADRDYGDVSQAAAENAKLLEDTMMKHGFSAYQKEWWHFSDTEPYPVDKSFTPPA